MPCHDADPPQISVKTMIHGLGGIGGSGGGDWCVSIHCPYTCLSNASSGNHTISQHSQHV